MNEFFPHTIDATMLSCFRSCPRKFQLQYLQHWKPKGESVHLHAGAAFASGIEAAREAFFVQKVSSEEAEAIGLGSLLSHYGDFEPPEGSAKTAERMAGALEFYFDRYPLGADGTSPILIGNEQGIELSFARPLPFNHPRTGDPILYTGRSDMVANFAGAIYVFDEKTTTQLGQSWAKQWDLRSQFTGYCWGLEDFGIKAAGVVVRGVSILKTKYDTMQVLTYRSEWEVERWITQTIRDLQRMQQSFETGVWDFILDHACTEYGGCAFSQICKSPNPEDWLPLYFERRVWDPLERRELTLEENAQKWGEELE